jgi:multidrug efflux pump subunit AcrB
MSLNDSVINAGIARFRAILLTSITTFIGLLPIMLETSLQARFLIPMAASLAFGILFATVITLLLIPCLYVILEDFKSLLSGKKTINTPAMQVS